MFFDYCFCLLDCFVFGLVWFVLFGGEEGEEEGEEGEEEEERGGRLFSH